MQETYKHITDNIADALQTTSEYVTAKPTPRLPDPERERVTFINFKYDGDEHFHEESHPHAAIQIGEGIWFRNKRTDDTFVPRSIKEIETLNGWTNTGNGLEISGHDLLQLAKQQQLADSYGINVADFSRPGHDLDLREMHGYMTDLPEKLHIGGNLEIGMTSIRKLPDGLNVRGNVNAYGSALEEIGERVKIHGSLDLTKTKVSSLPMDLQVDGSIWLSESLKDIYKVPFVKGQDKDDLLKKERVRSLIDSVEVESKAGQLFLSATFNASASPLHKSSVPLSTIDAVRLANGVISKENLALRDEYFGLIEANNQTNQIKR